MLFYLSKNLIIVILKEKAHYWVATSLDLCYKGKIACLLLPF